MSERIRYDVMREMADAVTYRGMILWLGLVLLITAGIIGTIALMLGNNHLYVHPDVAQLYLTQRGHQFPFAARVQDLLHALADVA